MIESRVRYQDCNTFVRFCVPVSNVGSQVRLSLDQWLEEWRLDDPSAVMLEDGLHISLSYRLLSDAGVPPENHDPESVELFASRHSSIAYLLGIAGQAISVETIGHVGSPDFSFLFFVDAVRVLNDDMSATPFAKDVAGRIRPMLPCAARAFHSISEWNSKGETTRAEQIVFISELRRHLDCATSALVGAAVPFSFKLDEHLNEFRTSRLGPVSLAWKPHSNGKVFDLELEHVTENGVTKSIELNQLDPENPIISLSATEHILLDPDVNAIARVAKEQRNKLRKHVEMHFHNPASLVPEGVSLKDIDLAAYSPRVLGFEPIVRAERAFDIQSSGVQWVSRDCAAGSGPFLSILIAQPAGGGIAVLDFLTPAHADSAVSALEKAISSGTQEPVELSGHRVAPTLALLNTIRDDISSFKATHNHDGEPVVPLAKPLPNKRLAAVIADEVENCISGVSSPTSLHQVPWEVLDELLLPMIKLKPHQKAAIEWLWAHYKRGEPGVLLADDMGLGKTLQIAAFLALQRHLDTETRPCLIVAPVILLDNWQDELEKFFRPHVFKSILVLHDEELRRHRVGGHLDINRISRSKYVLTNYHTMQAHQQSLLVVDWSVVVLDEAQAIKNSETYCSRAARGLKRSFGICATGTPVENRLSDLWSLFDFLRPGRPFASLKDFRSTYEEDLQVGIPEVRTALQYPGSNSSILRRTKSEVLALPPKVIEVHKVAMTPRQVEIEASIVRSKKNRGQILTILQDLQKLYQHPTLLLPARARAESFSLEHALDHSPKLGKCIEILRFIKAKQEKALVFTLWRGMQELMAAVFKRELDVEKVRVINGESVCHAKRYINELSKSAGFDVLILSPLAAGTGLTITAANHVIHYGRWWNPAKEDQATDRAYRIGQELPVHVHYPLLHHSERESEGFDVKLHELVEAKRTVARDFLAPVDDETLTEQEFNNLKEESVGNE